MSFLSDLFSPSRPLDFNGITDWHSHILPGVDDGVECIDDSLAILDAYGRMGVESVWLTPHVMEEIPNTPSALAERFSELQERYQGPVKLHLAAEHMIDGLFAERLEAGEVLPIGAKANMLLVETSYFNPPLNLHKALDRVKAKGFHPLLAHPERYCYIGSIADYEALKARGVLFQLNLLSLAGYYGKVARSKARQLLRRGLYDTFGSDIHHPGQVADLGALALPPSLLPSLRSLRSHLR